MHGLQREGSRVTTITLQPDLVEQVDQVAGITGIGTEVLIGDAIREHLRYLRREKLKSEIVAFESMHANLKEQYFGQFVVIHNGEVIDSDVDFEAVSLRVRACLGRVSVLIRRVGAKPQMELRFRSPRMEWTEQ